MLLKGKAIPVAGNEGPQGCKTSRLPHFLDNPLTDSGEVVSPTRRPPFTPGRFLVQRLSRTGVHSAAERIGSIEKSNNLIGN
jgi:hypothetical protein